MKCKNPICGHDWEVHNDDDGGCVICPCKKFEDNYTRQGSKVKLNTSRFSCRDFDLSELIFYIDVGNSRGRNRFKRRTLIPKNTSKRLYFEDVKTFIKKLLKYQDLKIKLAKENKYLSNEEKLISVACCLDTKIEIKKEAGEELSG